MANDTAVAADQAQARLRRIELELTAAPPRDPALAPRAAELIDHILGRYHETHRREFPQAVRLARKVEAVHGDLPQCPRGLADLLALMADDLEGHQRKEELILFPTMTGGGCQILRHPIARMMAEHEEVFEQLAQVAALTDGFTAPAGACHSWQALCQACAKLDSDLREHMRLENDVLFPHFL